MKTIVIVMTLISLIVFTDQQSLNCSKADQRRSDVIFSKLLTIGDVNRNFPSDDVETRQYCSETTQLVKEAENYGKQCLKDLPKQITLIFLYTIKNLMNKICKPGSKRLPELLIAAPCINKADNELNKCIVKSIDVFLGIQNAVEKLKLPYFCCNAVKLENCLIDSLKKIDGCNENHMETTRQFYNSLIGGILDLMCGEYTSSDKCSQLSAPPNKTKKQRRTKSLILPLIDIFDSFPLV